MGRVAGLVGGVIAAAVLMAVVFGAAFFLSRTTPDTHPAWFFGAAGTFYTMIVLYGLHRLGSARAQEQNPARQPP